MPLQIIWLYSIASVFLVSLISLVGLASFGIRHEKLKKILIYFVSFSAGALFGDAFLHLLPETIKDSNFSVQSAFYILLGIVIFFVLEKIIHWHHCHAPECKEHSHSINYMVLIGDAFHNFIDGIIIAASYILSIETGIATTLAVMFHEIPHELGNFSILLHGGFSRAKALTLNFLSALAAIFGAILTLWLGSLVQNIQAILIPIAAGTFIYIAGSDLVPELHKHSENLTRSFLQLLAFLLGIAIMALFLLLE
ncbi:ZIP family metal transporter [Candidatus Pacearchaeota archaeon]|nr:ZIP family metal transporter [Candidatus Pacearchaeota archaeon]